MEQVPTDTQIVQERIRSALLDKVSSEFVKGAELLFSLQDAYPEIEEDSRDLHEETIRALCIYAAYNVGEATDTVIRYSPQEVETIVGEGYSQQRIRTKNNFIVTTSDHTPPEYQQKRGVTREKLSDYDLQRRKETSKNENAPRQRRTRSHMERRAMRRMTQKYIPGAPN